MNVSLHPSTDSSNTTTQALSWATQPDEDSQTLLEAIPFIPQGLDKGWFGKISTTTILLLGTFGNVMTVIILRRLRSGWSAMNVYLTALALSDTAMLCSAALPMWMRKVLAYDVYASHAVVCKVCMWVVTSTANLSAWLLVALTAQRAASVVWPHRVSVICTRHKSVVVIVVITVVCSALQLHTVYAADVVRLGTGSGTKRRCTFGSIGYQEFWVNVWVKVNMFLYSVLPCVCLVVSNAVLGWKLTVSVKEAREKLSTGRELGQESCSRRKNASSVTITIIIVSAAFVVVTIPFMIYSNLFYGYVAKYPEAREIHFFLYDFFFVFGLSNFAWNFYLYCLTGSRFRGEFWKIVCGCRVSVSSSVSSTEGSYYVTEKSQVSEGGTRGTEIDDDF